uniref:Uncharacterized protein n=1 Tax=Arundo donax TaxID=35708 RepID=A0A0A9A0Q0_ARUDO
MITNQLYVVFVLLHQPFMVGNEGFGTCLFTSGFANRILLFH